MNSQLKLTERGRVNGFALILTNDYSGVNGTISTLAGTYHDGERMCETMERLNFETRWERNATAAITMSVVHEVANYPYLPNYKRLAFVFSGHGTDQHYLYMQDGKPLDLKDIMKQFYPGQSLQLGAVPKLFFIDACRGLQHPQSTLVTKGCHDVTLNVPEESNFLVAYSTTPHHRAYEVSGKGGVWMSIVSNKLRNTEASILDVLTAVNIELCLNFHSKTDCFQQPELISRLKLICYVRQRQCSVVALHSTTKYYNAH